METSTERTLSELYSRIDNLEKENQKYIETIEQTALKIDGFSAILAGLSFSKEIGVDTLISAIVSVSFSLDEMKKNLDGF